MAADGRKVRLFVDKLNSRYVYEFHLDNLAGSEKFFPAEGFYTLKRLVRN
ncbi:MAG: hypothetical protein QM775_06495 [Pirellulales bacterium]